MEAKFLKYLIKFSILQNLELFDNNDFLRDYSYIINNIKSKNLYIHEYIIFLQNYLIRQLKESNIYSIQGRKKKNTGLFKLIKNKKKGKIFAFIQ